MDINKNSFFAIFKRSLFDFSYYEKLVQEKLWRAVLYVYLLLVATLFIGVVKEAVILIPKSRDLAPLVVNLKRIIETGYPKNLIVTVKDGTVKTNVKEPYFIDFPTKEKNRPDVHFIAINTKAAIENYASYKSAVLITKNAIVYKDKGSSLKVEPIDKTYNFVIDRSKYDSLVKKFSPYIDYIPTIAIVFVTLFFIAWPFIAGIFLLIGKLILVFVVALLLLVVSKVLKKDLTYLQIYKMSLFGLTLPILIETLNSHLTFLYDSVFQYAISPSSFVYVVNFLRMVPNPVFLIFMICVVLRYKEKDSYAV